MRKFRNLVIGGIETKIFNLIVITVILLAVAFGIIMTNQSGMLSALTQETGARQQENTSAIISETMDTVMHNSMKSTTEMEAQIVDKMFRDIRSRLLMVSDYAAKILAAPERFSPVPYTGPDASKQGSLSETRSSLTT